jgi:CheY-like chemotaxis protein
VLSDPTAEAAPAETGTAVPHAAGTILHIDDSQTQLRLMRRIFEERPRVTVLSAATGEEGLRLARTHRPVVILLDLHLPDMPGEDVLRCLREEPTRDTRVIVLSADVSPVAAADAVRAGAALYLSKPVDIDHLLRVVDAAAHGARLP